jgi:hypothetical protein
MAAFFACLALPFAVTKLCFVKIFPVLHRDGLTSSQKQCNVLRRKFNVLTNCSREPIVKKRCFFPLVSQSFAILSLAILPIWQVLSDAF